MTEQAIARQVGELGAPPLAAFALGRAELARRAVPEGVLATGSVLPDAVLLHAHGKATTLYTATRGRPTVVVWYRGAWCPYCDIALRTYQRELLPSLTSRGVGLIAVSPQRPAGSLRTVAKNALKFPVLSDPGNALARALGILTGPSAEARAAQLQLGLDLTDVNADGTTDLPMPATVVLDVDHVVRWIDVHPDYTTRSEPADIIKAVDHGSLARRWVTVPGAAGAEGIAAS